MKLGQVFTDVDTGVEHQISAMIAAETGIQTTVQVGRFKSGSFVFEFTDAAGVVTFLGLSAEAVRVTQEAIKTLLEE